MERDRNVTFVIFAEGSKLSDFKGRYLRLLRRKPTVFWYLMWAWVAYKFGGSDFRHVLVGDGEVVYDNQYGQASFWPWEMAVKGFPRILGYYMVVGKDPNLASLPVVSRDKKAFWLPIPFLLMGFSRGWYQVFNCTTTAKDVLYSVGVRVPDRKVWNPTQLHLWMSSHGFDFIAESPPSLSQTVDPRAGSTKSPSVR